MKIKIKSILFAFIILFAGFGSCVNVQAQTASYSYTEELSEGYHLVVYVETLPIDTRTTTSTKTVSKVNNVVSDVTGEIVATYKLTATFNYPYNDTAKCTYATYSTTVNDSNWSFSDCSASKSGNKATGHFVAKKTVLGITTRTVEKTLSITCDKNGNIS